MEATTDWATRLKTSSLISGETGDSLSKPDNTKREDKEPEQAENCLLGYRFLTSCYRCVTPTTGSQRTVWK